MSYPARILFIAVYLLVGIGVVMTYSASAVYAEHVYQNPQYFLHRQIIFALIGTVFLFAAASVPISFLKQNARGLILLSIALLLLVFVPGIGRSGGGAQRWIRLGPVNFQPAELAKVVVCIYLSDYLSRKLKSVHKGGLKVFLPPIALIGIICVLTLLQPDLGSCAFITMITLVLFFIGGLQMRYVAIVSVIFLPVFYFLVIKVPYRLSRITAYLNPWEDPQGSGFQMIQSFLAFGLGGLHGVGLGQGTQKLFYLPSAHNDFILAIVGEELGFLGVGLVLLLFGVIFLCGMGMAAQSNHPFDKMLIIALTLFLVLQALINVMVATGLLPTKGLSLPFVSYGGTSLLVNLLGVGLLLGLDSHRVPKPGL